MIARRIVAQVRSNSNGNAAKRQAQCMTGPVEPHLCAHEFKKDSNAPSIVKMHKATKGFSEWSR